MPTIYTRTGSFKSDITYQFHCEYCGREYSVKKTLEKEVKLSSLINGPPTIEQFLTAAQNDFKRQQDTALSLGEKWQFPIDRKSAKCPNCGFLPTYMVNRKKTITTIILWLVIGVGVAIPFFIPGAMADTAMAITFGLLCFVPYLLLMWFLIHQLNPNRKLMRTLSAEGRRLAPPEKPRIVFSPILPK